MDIRQLRRTGVLDWHGTRGWRWADEDGNETASISIDVAHESLTFRYRQTIHGEERAIRVPVRLTRTACNYGNSRPWFRCPNCARRCARLFIVTGGMGCQRCLRMAYNSQRTDAIGRSWQRQAKAEGRLGTNLSRPKGMHQRTYDRVQDAYWREEAHKEELFCIAAARLVGLW